MFKGDPMRKKSKKKIKKKTLKKKRRIKANSRKASRNESIDLQKIVVLNFKHSTKLMKILRQNVGRKGRNKKSQKLRIEKNI